MIKLPIVSDVDRQECRLGRHLWSVPRLHELAKDLPVMEVPLSHLCIDYNYTSLTLREMAAHMVCVNKADLDCPIILDEDGSLMDGRHRIMKALINGEDVIKAVRFSENPHPCRIEED